MSPNRFSDSPSSVDRNQSVSRGHVASVSSADSEVRSRKHYDGLLSEIGTKLELASDDDGGGSVLAHRKASLLKRLILSPQLGFLMEAHDGLSAKIVEETGFEAIWASGLAISASLGVRDSNEASWTQVLEVLEFMSDATSIPILLDGDTGYGNFNNMRRLVRKLGQRDIGGVCIEDKQFPKTNSFIEGTTQPLADMDEFCGKIKAGKDAQSCDDFMIVARVEAFIAGLGLKEALERAEAYHNAGADAILIHSAKRSADEVLSFKREWGDRSPVVVVPTKYYATPTDVFRQNGFSVVIWANHLMRSCITSMQQTARQILEDQSLINVEDRIAPVAEVFRIQGAPELAEAEKRYLPKHATETKAILLAAARGDAFGDLTKDRPKCMLKISGEPILSHIIKTYHAAGIKNISAIRGYKKEAVDLDGVTYFDNDDASTTSEAFALAQALPAIKGHCIVSYGDVLFKKYIALELMEPDTDFAVSVDTNWRESRNLGRYTDFVTCSEDSSKQSFPSNARLLRVSNDLEPREIDGEWMGFLKLSDRGSEILSGLLTRLLAEDPDRLRNMDMGALMNELIAEGNEIRVTYMTGNWLDVDSVADALEGSSFQ